MSRVASWWRRRHLIPVKSIRRLDVRPGDTLVITLADEPDDPEALDGLVQDVSEALERRHPGVMVMCFVGDVDLSVVRGSDPMTYPASVPAP